MKKIFSLLENTQNRKGTSLKIKSTLKTISENNLFNYNQKRFYLHSFFKILSILFLLCLLSEEAQLSAHSLKKKPASLPKLQKAPEITGLSHWINSSTINSMNQLRGKVVLIDFWTYSCYNCINTLPFVKAWYKKYKEKGFIVLGIHAPEFFFERNLKNVKEAVKKHEIQFPVALDNGFQLWRAYRNRYWPAFYLIDKNGFIRYSHFGEGRYKETEKNILQLLDEKKS